MSTNHRGSDGSPVGLESTDILNGAYSTHREASDGTCCRDCDCQMGCGSR